MQFKIDDVLIFTIVSIAIVAVIAYFIIVAIGMLADKIVDYAKKKCQNSQKNQENAESNKNGIE